MYRLAYDKQIHLLQHHSKSMKKVSLIFWSAIYIYLYLIIDSANEVIYCADTQADSCGCLDDDDSIATGAESDENDDSDDEQSGKISSTIKSLLFSVFIEWQNNPSLSKSQFDEVDLDETVLDKELQCLLFK